MAAAPRSVGKQAHKSMDFEQDTVANDRFRRQFHRTRLCVFFMKGQCKYGTACSFAHEDLEVCEMPDLTKTSLCRKWMEGKCPLTAAECSFAHGKRELKMTSEYAKRAQDKAAAKTAKDARGKAPATPQDHVKGSNIANTKANVPDRQPQAIVGTDMVQMLKDGLDLVDPSVHMFPDRLDLSTMLGLKMPMQQGDASSTASTTLYPGDTRSTSSSEEDVLFASFVANETLPSPAYRAKYEADLKPPIFPPPGLDGLRSCEPMKVTLSSDLSPSGLFYEDVANTLSFGNAFRSHDFQAQFDRPFDLEMYSAISLTL